MDRNHLGDEGDAGGATPERRGVGFEEGGEVVEQGPLEKVALHYAEGGENHSCLGPGRLGDQSFVKFLGGRIHGFQCGASGSALSITAR